MKNLSKPLAVLFATMISFTFSMSAFATTYVVNPPSGEDCSFTFKNSAGDEQAVLFYKTDSEPGKFAVTFSTSWDSSQFADAFADQDAFGYFFIVEPSIPSTTLPTLQIRNPFVDQDDESTTTKKKIAIYQEKDGKLTDVTSSFSSGTNENGDAVLTTRTRTLGSYIFAEKKIDLKKVSPKTTSKDTSKTTTAKSKSTQPKVDKDGLILPQVK